MYILCVDSEEVVANCHVPGDYMTLCAAGWFMVGCSIGLILAPWFYVQERTEKL